MNHEPNRLTHASSPYLLQHAYNPVDWFEWGPEALEKARKEQKLILVSIGYSACHWCHVMERESFELAEVAEVMNKHFVCIKVDREERPDIDQIYMYAVQLMTGSGGWPLNCICLPDQRPIYGGTYFRKNDWINVLMHVARLWQEEPEKAISYAERLTAGISESERFIPVLNPPEYSVADLRNIIKPWKRTFDMTDGGYTRAPKFPLPNNWIFLLRYSHLFDDNATHVATMLTLEKMALGGIYDQIGGGFARYSVDGSWHVPHFEKMLYDNAQLIALYAEAWQFTGNNLFREVAEGSIAWLRREMLSEEGLFYSALDADSEGVEGKFYVWQREEFDALLGPDAPLMSHYYHVTPAGNWEEEETNILLRKETDEEFARTFEVGLAELKEKVARANQLLLSERSTRVRPGLDSKCLTAWNGMTIRALADASQIFDEPAHYDLAARAADFILDRMVDGQGTLFRNYKDGKVSIPGFLDDYAFFIDGLFALYEASFDERWLLQALSLTETVLAQFTDPEGPLLFYTPVGNEALIARKHEVLDNVIPSSNSAMAQNLRRLGICFDRDELSDKAAAMLAAAHPQMKSYGSGFSNWAIQLLNEVKGWNEIALSGIDTGEERRKLNRYYIPNKILLGGTKSALPLLKDKQSVETKIYICRNKVCQLPVLTADEAYKLIQTTNS
ncbi:thioredoxin domain-containing protein [Pedobacter yulinensis]|uniref:Thioredoxin domain-containing protein n=1 Tax=Pedobacter yulinensis TaxID=2126353 RepID=A0A2T3HGK0_9SPHI|nr:thioredoxin domain-containing protein [Pedobacter yulinensis]PST81568.1 thioredoxin domain-containing protein [Pedobacter yulinensis]